jgi:flavin reductase (DIM6/NTAB) family NADH-FMN oxidoreductase RutF
MVVSSEVNSYYMYQLTAEKIREGETMPQGFRKVRPEKIECNPFHAIGSDWMLVTSGSIESYDTMTASWGAMGVLWNKNIAVCFVRPQRYTYKFLERSSHFTLSFFPHGFRRALNYCGTHSGRDVNKAEATGLTPVSSEYDMVYFAEAKLVLLCHKIYLQDLDPSNFLTTDIETHYPKRDYHRMYLGEIASCLVRPDQK